MTTIAARKLLSSVPAGLSLGELARRTGMDYQKARRIAHAAKYRFTDGRSFAQNRRRLLDPDKVDWRQPNIDIARSFGVSRERVRKLRQDLGKRLVECRGRRK